MDRQIDITHDMRARARILMDRAMFIDLDNIRPPPNNALLNSQWGGDRYYDRNLALILRFLLDAADSSFIELYTGNKVRRVVLVIRQWLRARGFIIESTPSQWTRPLLIIPHAHAIYDLLSTRVMKIFEDNCRRFIDAFSRNTIGDPQIASQFDFELGKYVLNSKAVTSHIDTLAYLDSPDRQAHLHSLRPLCNCHRFPDRYRTAKYDGDSHVATTDLSVMDVLDPPKTQSVPLAQGFLSKGTKYRFCTGDPALSNAYATLYLGHFKSAFAKLIKDRLFQIDPSVSKQEVADWSSSILHDVELMCQVYTTANPATPQQEQEAMMEFEERSKERDTVMNGTMKKNKGCPSYLARFHPLILTLWKRLSIGIADKSATTFCFCCKFLQVSRVLEEHFKPNSAYKLAVNTVIPPAEDGSQFNADPTDSVEVQQTKLSNPTLTVIQHSPSPSPSHSPSPSLSHWH